MKKTILTLGSLVLVFTPVIGVVACGKKGEDLVSTEPAKHPRKEGATTTSETVNRHGLTEQEFSWISESPHQYVWDQTKNSFIDSNKNVISTDKIKADYLAAHPVEGSSSSTSTTLASTASHTTSSAAQSATTLTLFEQRTAELWGYKQVQGDANKYISISHGDIQLTSEELSQQIAAHQSAQKIKEDNKLSDTNSPFWKVSNDQEITEFIKVAKEARKLISNFKGKSNTTKYQTLHSHPFGVAYVAPRNTDQEWFNIDRTTTSDQVVVIEFSNIFKSFDEWDQKFSDKTNTGAELSISKIKDAIKTSYVGNVVDNQNQISQNTNSQISEFIVFAHLVRDVISGFAYGSNVTLNSEETKLATSWGFTKTQDKDEYISGKDANLKYSAQQLITIFELHKLAKETKENPRLNKFAGDNEFWKIPSVADNNLTFAANIAQKIIDLSKKLDISKYQFLHNRSIASYNAPRIGDSEWFNIDYQTATSQTTSIVDFTKIFEQFKTLHDKFSDNNVLSLTKLKTAASTLYSGGFVQADGTATNNPGHQVSELNIFAHLVRDIIGGFAYGIEEPVTTP